MTTGIISIGTTNPPFKRDQVETAELIISALNLKPSEKRLLKSIYKHSGIKTRHSILKDYCKLPKHVVSNYFICLKKYLE